ncbi:unnamed protein product [Urochloa humidicola]
MEEPTAIPSRVQIKSPGPTKRNPILPATVPLPLPKHAPPPPTVSFSQQNTSARWPPHQTSQNFHSRIAVTSSALLNLALPHSPASSFLNLVPSPASNAGPSTTSSSMPLTSRSSQQHVGASVPTWRPASCQRRVKFS